MDIKEAALTYSCTSVPSGAQYARFKINCQHAMIYKVPQFIVCSLFMSIMCKSTTFKNLWFIYD